MDKSETEYNHILLFTVAETQGSVGKTLRHFLRHFAQMFTETG